MDLESQDVYMQEDFDILYKGRRSIVLIYMPSQNENMAGHFETVGIRTRTGINTVFSPDHEFITTIRNRIDQKIAIGSGRGE